MKYCTPYYTLILLLFLLFYSIISYPSPVQAQGSILAWHRVEKPGLKNNIIVTPSAVSKIAIGNANIIYSIDSENNKVYRSTNCGESWSDITSGLIEAGAILPAEEITVAVGNPVTIAIVTNNRTKVYLSADSGSTWHDTGVPSITGTIQCIAMTTYILSGKLIFDIAIGTADLGNTTTLGQLYIAQVGILGLIWRDQKITIDPSHGGAEISAIGFSPNYRSDGTILVVGSTAADVTPPYQNKTWLCLGRRDFLLQTTLWNSSYVAAYPVEIATTGDAVGVTQILSSVALPSDYTGTDPAKRITFVSYNGQTNVPAAAASNDVYRINDTTPYRLNAAGGVPVDITCIDYYGTISSGILLAGDQNQSSAITVQVRRCLNPTSTSPPPGWQTAAHPPSGPGNAYVRWTPDGQWALCGTSVPPVVLVPPIVTVDPDESAFSRSQDNGDNWEQTSLIDTNIKITDIGIAPDSRSLFLATYSTFGTEGVWRSAGEPLGNFWGRVMTTTTLSNRLIIRFSPHYGVDDYTLYVAEVGIGNNQLLLSNTRGNTWHRRLLPGPIIDMLIVDRHTILVALTGGSIRKSINDGQVWQAPVVTGLDEINMLAMSSNGHIFVGSRDGKVAYSVNDSASFSEIPQSIDKSSSGDVQVVADANYSDNHIIYAATNNPDEGVWRWTIGTSTDWEQIDKQITELSNGECISGLKMGGEGTLYALRSEAKDVNHFKGGMNRSLNPANPESALIEFDILNRTLPAGTNFNPVPLFPNTMPHLRISGNAMQNDLWSVYHVFTGALHTDDIIYRFTDNICKSGPGTSDTGNIGCDPASGRNQGFGLTWEQISLSNRHEIQVAKDDIFTMRVGTEPPSNPFYVPPQITNPAYYMNPAQWLECGHNYFWRVRTRGATSGEIIRSPWSTVREFIIKAGLPMTSPSLGPQLLAPDNDCACSCTTPLCFSWSPCKETTRYRFELSENSDMTNLLVTTNVTGTTAYQYNGRVKYNAAYFWRVQALEPAPSEWSATFSFMTGAAPVSKPLSAQKDQTPIWVWMIIATGVLTWVCLFVLVLRRLR